MGAQQGSIEISGDGARSLAGAPMRLRLAMLLTAGLLSGPACVAVSGGTDAQDACRFGQVSPEEYQALAAEIAALPPIEWEEALKAENKEDSVASAVRGRLAQVVAGREGADEKVAAMHGLMRSIGAEFAWAHGGTELANYHYRLDVNRIGLSRFVLRWGQFVLGFHLQKETMALGEIRNVTALLPYWGEPSQPGLKPVEQIQQCPPLPKRIPEMWERWEMNQ